MVRCRVLVEHGAIDVDAEPRPHRDVDPAVLQFDRRTHQLAPESAAYNIASAVRIRSAVDLPALHSAFQQLIDRHATLRSVFIASDGEPKQRVLAAAPAWFHAHDISDWSDSALEAYLATLPAGLFKKGVPQEEFRVLRAVVGSLLREAESAIGSEQRW